MDAGSRGIREGYHAETRKVSVLTSRVAEVKDGWKRRAHLDVSGMKAVSEIYQDLSTLIATFGALAQKDTGEFAALGVNIEVQDAQDAQVCEAPQ